MQGVITGYSFQSLLPICGIGDRSSSHMLSVMELEAFMAISNPQIIVLWLSLRLFFCCHLISKESQKAFVGTYQFFGAHLDPYFLLTILCAQNGFTSLIHVFCLPAYRKMQYVWGFSGGVTVSDVLEKKKNQSDNLNTLMSFYALERKQEAWVFSFLRVFAVPKGCLQRGCRSQHLEICPKVAAWLMCAISLFSLSCLFIFISN